MAKKRYQVTKSIQLGTPADPDDFSFDEQIDLAVLLSQRLQRNVRQGHVFNIHKIEGQLSVLNDPLNTQELDIGVAVQGEALWAPATKNSARAWRHAFSVWRKQKSLAANAIGPMVRYDDFEVAYNYGYVDSRTSTLYAGGLEDGQTEQVCIYGNSNEGEDITLEDIYESAQPIHSPSRFPISNAMVKSPKFLEEFPPHRVANFGCHWSAINEASVSVDSGASYGSTPAYITDGACLAGVLVVRGRMLPENTASHIQDDLMIDLTITVSIGSPLVSTGPKRKSKPKRKMYRKKASRRRYSRRKS